MLKNLPNSPLGPLSDQRTPAELSDVLSTIDELTFTNDRVRGEIRSHVVALHAAANALQDAKNAKAEMTKAAQSLNAALQDFASATDKHKGFCAIR